MQLSSHIIYLQIETCHKEARLMSFYLPMPLTKHSKPWWSDCKCAWKTISFDIFFFLMHFLLPLGSKIQDDQNSLHKLPYLFWVLTICQSVLLYAAAIVFMTLKNMIYLLTCYIYLFYIYTYYLFIACLFTSMPIH